jgi:hypothetical protein
MSDIERILPPPCPVCGSKTTLKESRKHGGVGNVMCFFKCMACHVEYPQLVDAARVDPIATGTINAKRKEV